MILLIVFCSFLSPSQNGHYCLFHRFGSTLGTTEYQVVLDWEEETGREKKKKSQLTIEDRQRTSQLGPRSNQIVKV